MRVVTLLPAATEIVAAIGAAHELVGISHECDFPPELHALPRVTWSAIDPGAPSRDIDGAVRALFDSGKPVIAVDGAALSALAPDLVITQDLCEVCAVEESQVRPLAGGALSETRLLSLKARNLAGIWDDIRAVGQAMGRSEEAGHLVGRLSHRLVALGGSVPGARRPRVLTVEWLDPLYLAGHWVPDLVSAAGGENLGAKAGDHSRRWSWPEARALQPDLIVLMLCGFDAERAASELAMVTDPDALALLDSTPTYVLDGNAYTSRPGPRVVQGAEQIHAAIQGRAVPITRSSTHIVWVTGEPTPM